MNVAYTEKDDFPELLGRVWDWWTTEWTVSGLVQTAPGHYEVDDYRIKKAEVLVGDREMEAEIYVVNRDTLAKWVGMSAVNQAEIDYTNDEKFR